MMKGDKSTSGILLNPRAGLLGKQNAILSGTGTRYYVPHFEGCLSLKSAISGSATWETHGRRFQVHENTYLILNDHQHYDMTIDSTRSVTTFCVFFARGFVEDVFRAQTSPIWTLLDEPEPSAPTRLRFIEQIEPLTGSVARELLKLKKRARQDQLSTDSATTVLYDLAERILARRQQVARIASRLPGIRRETREELLRRVLRGRDFLLSSLSGPAPLEDAARAACLSPFHFHRAFRAAFGETPHQHAARHRLERARHLLSKGDRSVTEICFDTGFESLGSFSTLFRRTYGVAPGEYLRRKN